MREFQGLNSDYKLIQTALKSLAEEGIKGQALISRMKTFRQLNPKITEFYKSDLPDYSSIDRLRGEVLDKHSGLMRPARSNNDLFSKLLWIFLHKNFPQMIESKSTAESKNPFYFQMLEFYDANHTRSFQRIREKAGTYELYHFSERFKNEKHAVVKGRLDILAVEESILVEAEVSEAYDGTTFGGEPIVETYSGYCLYKHSSIIIYLRKDDKERSPKMYLFDHPDLSARGMTGHLCEILPGKDLFTSPVYAKKLDRGVDVERNISHHSSIDKDVLKNLLINPLPGFYEPIIKRDE